MRQVYLSYSNKDPQASALRLLFTLFPEWQQDEGEIKFTRFTDGITNTLLKATKRRPGLTEQQIDEDAVLLRAYGRGTEVLIDREKECSSHQLLASYNLAPELLARFQNGIVYRFIQGQVCTPADLTREPVWRGVAQRLGEWHAKLPVIAAIPTASEGQEEDSAAPTPDAQEDVALSMTSPKVSASAQEINAITPGKATPNIWTVMQKWIFALPNDTPAEKDQKATLQRELEKTVGELAELSKSGSDGLILGHCDLLSGNVIQQLPASTSLVKPDCEIDTVSFIDFEYATPCPAAFDLVNHFAEWGGFDCDYNMLPTKSTRRAFLEEYLASYNSHVTGDASKIDLDELCTAIDQYRGIPGLYWGIWALIQATISQIDFDYASYAVVRLGEYWAFRDEQNGTRPSQDEKPLRERRWAEA